MSLFDKEIPPEYLRILQQFRFIDDTFFAACLDGDIPCMELILRLVLQRSDIGVQSVVTQQSAQNLYGRGVRFDALARDRAGKIYNCEVQRADEGAIPRRARYNNCLVDHRELAKGAAFKEPLINARFFRSVEVDENIPSPQEKGDREAVEEVWKGGGLRRKSSFEAKHLFRHRYARHSRG